jgi:hypothetical protein
MEGEERPREDNNNNNNKAPSQETSRETVVGDCDGKLLGTRQNGRTIEQKEHDAVDIGNGGRTFVSDTSTSTPTSVPSLIQKKQKRGFLDELQVIHINTNGNAKIIRFRAIVNTPIQIEENREQCSHERIKTMNLRQVVDFDVNTNLDTPRSIIWEMGDELCLDMDKIDVIMPLLEKQWPSKYCTR